MGGGGREGGVGGGGGENGKGAGGSGHALAAFKYFLFLNTSESGGMLGTVGSRGQRPVGAVWVVEAVWVAASWWGR